MFPSHALQESTICFQLLASLEEYETELARLEVTPLDATVHGRLADVFDRMQLYAASLPQLAASWVALLISRAEYMQALRPSAIGRSDSDAQLLLEQHREAIQSLRMRCRRRIRRH